MSVTKTIKLVELDPSIEESLFEEPGYIDAMTNADWGKVAELTLGKIGRTLQQTPVSINKLAWSGYFVVDVETNEFVGSCAYKGPPNANGEVEIAYFTFPDFEGMGYASEMTAKLIEMARSNSSVSRILAHTLPEENASVQVLKKSGMSFVGEVTDPEDGKVWQWKSAEGT